jgi:hypothetical protein
MKNLSPHLITNSCQTQFRSCLEALCKLDNYLEASGQTQNYLKSSPVYAVPLNVLHFFQNDV